MMDLFNQPIASTFSYVHQKENNPSSMRNLKENKKHFSKQCNTLYMALMRGETHNGDTAKELYGIRDMIRRYHDLLDAGVRITPRTIPNSHGMIEIFMTQLDKEFNKGRE